MMKSRKKKVAKREREKRKRDKKRKTGSGYEFELQIKMKERCFCIFFSFSLFLIFTLFLIRSLTVLSFVQFRRRTRRRVKEKKNFQQKLKKCWNTSNSSRSFNFYFSRSSLPFLIFYSLNPYFSVSDFDSITAAWHSFTTQLCYCSLPFLSFIPSPQLPATQVDWLPCLLNSLSLEVPAFHFYVHFTCLCILRRNLLCRGDWLEIQSRICWLLRWCLEKNEMEGERERVIESSDSSLNTALFVSDIILFEKFC